MKVRRLASVIIEQILPHTWKCKNRQGEGHS